MKTGHNPKTMIKAKFSNRIHDIFQPDKQKIPGFVKFLQRESKFKKMSDAEKAKLFDQIYQVYEECSAELINYLNEKRFKKKVKKLRESKQQAA